MTALQLNADIYRNLAVLSEDQSLLDKAAKYIRRLVKQMTDDPTCMSKEELFAAQLQDYNSKIIINGKGEIISK